MTLLRRSAAEALGTAFLLAGVVGSGIMAERLSGGNHAIALLANTLATGGVPMCLIAALGPISGAHSIQPCLLPMHCGGLPWREVPAYIVAQLSGAMIGVAAANAMFGFPLFFVSHRVRTGPAQWLGDSLRLLVCYLSFWGVHVRALFSLPLPSRRISSLSTGSPRLRHSRILP
jgi:glycerol uptake facilitator-like aquaporin